MRPDLAGGVEGQQLLDVFGVFSRIARRESAPEDADDLAGLQQGQVQRNLRNTRRETDDQEPSFPPDRAESSFCVVAADCVVDDIRAARAAGLFEHFGKRLLAIAVKGTGRIDHSGICAMLNGEIDLLLAGCGRHDLGPGGLGEFHRR